jgi:hypothetical protein
MLSVRGGRGDVGIVGARLRGATVLPVGTACVADYRRRHVPGGVHAAHEFACALAAASQGQACQVVGVHCADKLLDDFLPLLPSCVLLLVAQPLLQERRP